MIQNVGREQDNLAVLFDADNISKDYVKAIMDACARYGRAIIKRSYGDWTDSRLQGWGPVFREFAIKPIQQFMFTKGKNITDSSMTIDAMDILHSRDVDVFVLVSSDSDFTGLATRIREDGLKVIGVGRKITSPSLIASPTLASTLVILPVIGTSITSRANSKLLSLSYTSGLINCYFTNRREGNSPVLAIPPFIQLLALFVNPRFLQPFQHLAASIPS